jgi:hypothetical protein
MDQPSSAAANIKVIRVIKISVSKKEAVSKINEGP